MAASFGTRLKAQRERQQVTLATIAERTKIRLALLEDLERDDVSRWPAGIFRRSYFRNYAAAIGLDPELAVREFLAQYPEPAEESPVATLAEAESGQPGHRPKTRLHYLLASAIGAVSKPLTKERYTSEVVPSAVPPDPAREEVDEEVELKSDTDAGEPVPGVQVDLPALAQLCTRIVEAGSASDLEALLGEAARMLRATGIIVWPWDSARGVLVPSLSHGYPARTLNRLPTVAADADNPIGAAFRSSARQIVAGSGSATSAIVVPLTRHAAVVGVLAVEFANGLEPDATAQALAAILAAQLSLPVEAVQTLQAEPSSRHAIA
jgi:transcriptional regulator with XRE-family HTH domain